MKTIRISPTSALRPCSQPQREALAARLHARRAEFEQATLSRVQAVSSDSEVTDPQYAAGLRSAVGAAISYGIEGIEAAATTAPAPLPAELLVQARQAAYNGVGIDVVLRRYCAGHALLADLVLEEARQMGTLGHGEVQSVLRAVSVLVDQLLSAISAEYQRAREGRMRNSTQRRAEQVRRILVGEASQGEGLDYSLEGWHLGALASGPGIGEVSRALAAALDRDLLLVYPEPAAAWIWLGGKQPLCGTVAREAAEASVGEGYSLAFGEPGQGIYGWRLTHRQAKAAMPIATREERGPVCYLEVGLLASVLEDDTLQSSLRDAYLAPLAETKDGGLSLRETLRAYFAAGRNTTSAAAALGVSRRTVNSRLRTVEERVGRTLDSCLPELEITLRLDLHAK